MSRAPVDAPDQLDQGDEESPLSIRVPRRQALIFGLFALTAVVFLYFGLPRLVGFGQTWQRLKHGDPKWLLAAAGLECMSFVGYVWLFRTVFVRGRTRIGWGASYQITMAGVAATRLFAAAGAGGIALTAWALRRSGMERRIVACRMVAFLVLLYTVYALALLLGGVGLYTGVLEGGGSFAITIVPAIFGLAMLILGYGSAAIPEDIERRLAGWAAGHGRTSRLIARLAAAPATMAAGVRTALRIVGDREVGVLGAVIWWGFDIATLWASFHAFGPDPPPTAVIVVAYFVGQLGNTLPLPGGIGGVDGGLIGAFAAFDVNLGYATVAVLAYRAFAFWLPTIPGAFAYLQLRRTVAQWRDERAAEPAPA